MLLVDLLLLAGLLIRLNCTVDLLGLLLRYPVHHGELRLELMLMT